MQDEEPKSAYELAMERLRKKDAEEGIDEQPLTTAQRDAIAEARKICKAKLAELEILFKSKTAGVADPQAREALEESYRRDVQRATDERDRKIAKIRGNR
jgi:hypothetical protein